MRYTSPGQMNNEAAAFIYKNARKMAESLVKSGKIPASALETEFAKMVADGLRGCKMPVPKDILAKLPATSTARSVAKALGVGGAAGGGAIVTSGGGASGILGSVAAFATNPVTIGVAAAAAIGGLGYLAYKKIFK